MLRIEHTIFKNLIRSPAFLRDASPHLKGEYFIDRIDSILYNKIADYIEQYKGCPTEETIRIQIDQDRKIEESDQEVLYDIIDGIIEDVEETPHDWLMIETEKFCQKKSLYNAMVRSLKIADGKSEEDPALIPSLLSEALAVAFNTQIGMDYFEDAESRYNSYITGQDHVPCHLDFLNYITKGGCTRKTLNCILASTGVGKSTIMCDLAAGYLQAGYNVLYLTMEMSEERIGERMDANLLDIDISTLYSTKRDVFMSRIKGVQGKTNGRIKIKEFSAGATIADFRKVINELKLKHNFKADIIIGDYLGIMGSVRMKMGGSTTSYGYLKAVAEEFRGLMKEEDAIGWTGMQTNRNGIENNDVGMKDTSDSMAVVHTLDLYIAVMTDEEQEENGTMTLKQLKNRYAGITGRTARFLIGIDRSKMRMFDLPGVNFSAPNGSVDRGNTNTQSQNCDTLPVMEWDHEENTLGPQDTESRTAGVVNAASVSKNDGFDFSALLGSNTGKRRAMGTGFSYEE